MSHDFTTHNIAFQTPWITIYEKDTWYALASPSGKAGGGCLIMDSNGQVLLVEIYRHPLNKVVMEIPRGAGDPDADMTAIDTAIREASEETGVDLSQAEIINLGVLHPDDGILSYESQICAAILPHPFDDIQVDKNEVIDACIMSFASLKQMIISGDINDSFTIAAAFRLDSALSQTV
jgi:ADP-ribose pyrophosphatase